MPRIFSLLMSLVLFSVTSFAGTPKNEIPSAYVKRFAAHATVQDWARDFSTKLSDSDKAFLKGKIAGAEKSKLPKVTVDGARLKIETGGKFVDIVLIDAEKGLYKIGGSEFTFDHKRSFKEQFQILEPLLRQAVKDRSKNAGLLPLLFLPEADAQAEIAVAVIGILAVLIVVAAAGLVVGIGQVVWSGVHDAQHADAIKEAKKALDAITSTCQWEAMKQIRGPAQTSEVARMQSDIRKYKESTANAFGDCEHWRGLGISQGEGEVCAKIDTLSSCLKSIERKVEKGFEISKAFIEKFGSFMAPISATGADSLTAPPSADR